MKTIIRRSVFETNSSSSHSVSIPQTYELLDTIEPDENGNIALYGGEYGWGHIEYNDAETKANYMAVWAKEYSDSPEVSMNFLNQVLTMHTGAKEIVYSFGSDFHNSNYAYIDHQSSDSDYFTELFGDAKRMLNFIFNRKSILVISNDNM
jgi:hypothetical protein